MITLGTSLPQRHPEPRIHSREIDFERNPGSFHISKLVCRSTCRVICPAFCPILHALYQGKYILHVCNLSTQLSTQLVEVGDAQLFWHRARLARCPRLQNSLSIAVLNSSIEGLPIRSLHGRYNWESLQRDCLATSTAVDSLGSDPASTISFVNDSDMSYCWTTCTRAAMVHGARRK
jgi:hypothetical protein